MSKVNINFQYDDLCKIIDYLPVAVGITDLKGNILKINKKSIKLFGYKLNEIPTISDWQNKVFPDSKYRKQIISSWKNDSQISLKDKKEIKPKIFSITTKNNKILQIEISFKIIKNNILVIFDDITEKKETEEELKNSNNFLNNIIKQSPNSNVITDKNGTIIEINQACCNLLNITPNEVIGKYNVLKDNIVKEQGYLPLVKQVFEKGETARFELKYDSSALKSLKLKKSKFIILDVTIFPIKNTAGEIINAVIQHIDITERKLSEHALRESENRYKELANSINDVFFAMDKNLKFTYFNKASEKLTGITSKKAIGRSLYDLFPNTKNSIIDSNLINAIKNKKNINFSSPYNLNGKNYIFEIIFNPTNNGISAYVKDITKQKESEDSLIKSEERFRALYLNMIEGVALHQTIYDKKGKPKNYKIIDINPKYEKILNLKRDNVIGRLATEIYGTQEPPYLKEYANVGETGIPYYFETYFPPMDKYFAISVAPIAKDKWASIFFDITKRKQAEEEIKHLNRDLAQHIFERTAQLESVNKELESFSYSVSHDLRAPLRHIHGFLNILGENIEHTLDKENQRIFSIILKSAEHMGKLVDSLLSFSKMNKNEIYYEEINFNDIAANIINDFKPETNNRNIKWEIHKLPKVKGDKILLRQVMQNLISNAIKYTEKCKNTIIEINYMKESSNEITFFIRDNGIGFDMNYVNKLFGVFQRLHNSDEYKGIGIGLANVKKIINRHGGNVWAQGELNKGATFYFSIPKYNKNKNPSK